MNNIKSFFIIVLCVFAISSCNKPSIFTESAGSISDAAFQKEIDGQQTNLYTLSNNNGMGMKVTNYGARIVALCVPDKNGKPVDVATGYSSIDEYINQPEQFFGAAIGRYGNRIAKATFTIDSVAYQLAANDGVNHLHGGPKGYFDVVWTAEQTSSSKIVFKYISPDGEEGYPGNLEITMSYEITPANELKIVYSATTDKTTVCNLTNHTYFNLSGDGAETINDHLLMIKANDFTPVDSVLIPTGELGSVDGTPMDFKTPTAIGARVNDEYVQLQYGGGYDHNWVIAKEKEGIELVASLESPITGIKMEVLTDQPGIQFYGGNFMDGKNSGKAGKPYVYRSALCLETQHFPDSPNQPQFPTTLLEPGQEYGHVCIYKFSVQK